MAVKPPLTFLGKTQKFLGNTLGEAAGFAAGVAVAPALRPELQDLINETWQLHPSRVPDAGLLAEGLAKGHVDGALAHTWAEYQGLNGQRFDSMVASAQNGPGIGEAFRLWRRGKIDESGFRLAAKRAALEQAWIDALAQTKREPLPPVNLANAIHRGLIPDPGLLAVPAPGGGGQVPAYPVYQIDALADAAAWGYDRDELGVLVGEAGNPMGAHEAAQAVFRGVIDQVDYERAIAEGNTRNEWGAAIFEQTRQIPTARDFMENALRGHHDETWAKQQAARHGMSPDDAHIIYQNQGRAMNLHQISQALAWGAHYNPAPDDEKDPWHAATLLGPVRPEYYELNDALKYIVPSAFALRTLQENGALTPDEAFTWYKRLGWEPGLSRKVADAFGTSKTQAAKEATVTDLLTLHDGGKLTDAQTRSELAALGYAAPDIQKKLDLADARRVVSSQGTAITDLHGAFKKQDLTRAECATALQTIGVADWAATRMLDNWQAYLDAFPPPPPKP